MLLENPPAASVRRTKKQKTLLEQAKSLVGEGRLDQAAALFLKEYARLKVPSSLEGSLSQDAQQVLTQLAAIYDRSKTARRGLNSLTDAGDKNVIDFVPQMKEARAAIPDPAVVKFAISIGEYYRPAREAQEAAIAAQARAMADAARRKAESTPGTPEYLALQARITEERWNSRTGW